MNIRDLKYLVSLAEHCHFGKAADECFVSQPALSMQIKKLEEMLNVKLLERTNKSVMLTDEGKIIAEQARSILQQVKDIQEFAKSTQDPYQGELKIGIIPTLAPYLLPHIISQLSSAYPKLSLYLIEEQTPLLIEKLLQGKIDTAILALPITENNLTSTSLFEEEFLLAVPNTHPLAKRKQIKNEDLLDEDILLLEEGHCLRDQALSFCHRAKISEIQNFRGTSLETLRHMIASGVGMTFMPKLACKPQKGISYIPFIKPKPHRLIGMVWRTASCRKTVLKDIGNQIKKNFE